MARNRISVSATPREIFDVLSDPARYPEWVLGTTEVVEADGSWPKPGSTFIYRAGRKPFDHSGTTEVLAADPPRRLLLRTTLPIGPVEIDLEVHPCGAGSTIVLTEHALTPPLRHPLEPAFHVRNTFMLPSLKALVEGRSGGRFNRASLMASGPGGHWLDEPVYEEVLARAEHCYLAVSSRSGPHVTPIAFSSSSGRIWIVTGRTTLKARMIERDPAVAVVVREGERSIVLRGRAMVFDPLRPWQVDPFGGLFAVPALSRYLVEVAGRLGGYLRESPGAVVNLNPVGRVLISVAPESVALLRDGTIVDRRGPDIGGDGLTSGPALPDASGRPLDLDDAPPDVARLAEDGRVQAILGWSGADGIGALPAHWHAERGLASVPSVLLGTMREAPASICLDSDTGAGLEDQKGVLIRGTGRVVGVGERYAAVAIEQEKTTTWSAADSGSSRSGN